MKAMILAAGKGTRLRPLTYAVPKPMMPLLGRPAMELVVERLRAHGFDKIVVNTSYLAPQIEDYFRDGRRFGVEMAHSFEGGIASDGTPVDTTLGTAGALRRVQDFSGFFDYTFGVVCGDTIFDANLGAAIASHIGSGAIATILARPVPRNEVSNHSIIVADEYGWIQGIQEEPRPADAKGTLASTGIYLFEPAIFDYIPSGQIFDIATQLLPALLAAKAPVQVSTLPFHCVDLNTPRDVWTATSILLRQEFADIELPGREIGPRIHCGLHVSLPRDLSRIQGPVWIGASTTIADGASIVGPAAIGAGCVVESGAVIERSILWDHTRVSGHATLRNQIICGQFSVTTSGAAVSLDEADLGWAVDDARRSKRADDEHGLSTLLGEHGRDESLTLWLPAGIDQSTVIIPPEPGARPR